ncbi:MAG: hypothetical protein HZY79_04590 [Rhodoblastus sp.]|nr:MAG: hypothetical protein HZY79_04590 [Rhodoblastus sp.]
MSREHFVIYFPYMIMAICVMFGVRFMLGERPGPAYVCFLLGVMMMPFLSWADAGRKLIPYVYG